MDSARELDAKRLQREDVEHRRYLFAQDREGHWSKNLHGTILTPVWVPCSSFEIALLGDDS